LGMWFFNWANKRYATKSQMDNFSDTLTSNAAMVIVKIDSVQKENREGLKRLETSQDIHFSDLHEKVNDVRERVARLEGREGAA